MLISSWYFGWRISAWQFTYCQRKSACSTKCEIKISWENVLNEERFHNSHLEVINNAISKESMNQKPKNKNPNPVCKVLYWQVHPGMTLYTLPITHFYSGGRIHRCWRILLHVRELYSGQTIHYFQWSQSINLHHILVHSSNLNVHVFSSLLHMHSWSKVDFLHIHCPPSLTSVVYYFTRLNGISRFLVPLM